MIWWYKIYVVEDTIVKKTVQAGYVKGKLFLRKPKVKDEFFVSVNIPTDKNKYPKKFLLNHRIKRVDEKRKTLVCEVVDFE